ncbi:MAG: ComF family protein [Clostridia bacterium]|nr:ComF family protein [Clostridia bacterium]
MGKFIKWLRRADSRRGYTCDWCGREVFSYPTFRVCDFCEAEMQYNGERVCPKCGRETVAEGVCLTCKAAPPAFALGVSAFVYDGESATLVNALKEGRKRLALYLGEKTAERLLHDHRDLLMQTEWLVVPVPLTPRSLRQRGYNQAETLVQAIVTPLEKAGVKLEIDPDILQKHRETGAQKDLEAKNRRENVAGAYRVHKRAACRGKNVLLVDDIMTTGATGDECAKILLSAGAAQVLFCVAAATPENP